MRLAARIYQRLAQAFPHEFKVAYGTEVKQLGDDVIEEVAKRQGAPGLVRLLADIAIRVPVEYLSEMRGDLRYGLRAMRKAPGFALVGIVSMALAIGLSTRVYSTMWALLFRELPGAANAKRLVMPEEAVTRNPASVSYYEIEQYREQKDLFAGAAAFQSGVPFNVTFEGNLNAKPERIFGQLVSPDYFTVLGVEAQQGRMLSPELDRVGDAPTVVISDRFWRNRLNSSPNAVGQVLHLNGQIATIVGIAPKNFEGALSLKPAELFVPITAPAALAPELANDVLHQRNAKEFLALMCLASGVSINSAEAGLEAVTRRLEKETSMPGARMDEGRRFQLMQAGTRAPVPREFRPVIAGFLLALMGLVLSLACINLANMLMARTANRRKELAIRLALGASRFRVLRQMMAEGIALSLLGGAAGLGVAYALAQLSAHYRPPTVVPTEFELNLDWRAAAFAFGVAVLCGIGFSLAPGLQATRADAVPAMKEGSALLLPGYGRFGLRNFLMVTQVAASLMLLLVTGFLVIGMSKSTSLETRFDADTMYLFALDPLRDGYTAEKAQELFAKLPERLKSANAVRSVTLAGQPPFSDPEDTMVQVSAQNATGAPEVVQPIGQQSIGAGYFASFGEPMVAGREFDERDVRGGDASTSIAAATTRTTAGMLPVVLTESADQKLFGKESAIGKRVRDEKRAYEVVGVVRDVKDVEGVTLPTMYLPLTARDFVRPSASGIMVMVRSDAGRDALEGIRKDIEFLDPTLNIFGVKTLSSYLEQSRAAMRFSIETWSGIGMFGLVLAAIGLAGVTGYAVARRRKEIAIRMAVGASPAQVLGLVLREGTALTAVGTALGYLGAVALARVLGSLAHMFADALRFGTNDPLLLVGAPLLLAAVALLACYIPARRSTQIDPLEALRQE